MCCTWVGTAIREDEGVGDLAFGHVFGHDFLVERADHARLAVTT
jgi:hypothetical protein